MRSNRRAIAATIVAVAVCAGASLAERGDDANRSSKNGMVRDSIDGVEVTIEYGRPSVRDRKIWGGLVPWDTVWRTGADEATTISFGGDVWVEGEPISAGRYALFTLPGMETWIVAFNNTPDQWGAFSYDDAEDALRVEVEPLESEHVETLTFAIEKDSVVLRWEKVAVSFRVAAADG